jgi:L-malate glycosyltransferase
MGSRSVNQVVIGASTRDAITNMAITLQQALRPVTRESGIFAFLGGDYTITDEVAHMNDMPFGGPEDVLIYHSSFGQPGLTPKLLQRPEKLVLIYHNITPAHYYEKIDREFANGLEWGRTELSIIRDKVVQSFADSQFNADDLATYGYENVVVIPAGLRPRRVNPIPTDVRLLAELNCQFPEGFILFVSQVLPHKRVELALEVVHLLRSVHGLKIGLVVAGPTRRPRYFNDVQRMRAKLPEAHVLFAGEVDDGQLATLYRACRAFISTSDHEGLSIPPLEAMASGAPVIVRGCGAVPDTVGDAALIVPAEAGVCELTEAVAIVLRDQALATYLRIRGYERVNEIERADPTAEFMSAMRPLLS